MNASISGDDQARTMGFARHLNHYELMVIVYDTSLLDSTGTTPMNGPKNGVGAELNPFAVHDSY